MIGHLKIIEISEIEETIINEAATIKLRKILYRSNPKAQLGLGYIVEFDFLDKIDEKIASEKYNKLKETGVIGPQWYMENNDKIDIVLKSKLFGDIKDAGICYSHWVELLNQKEENHD